MDGACKEFIKILKAAESLGSHLNVDQIGKKLSRFPPGADALAIYNECKSRSWIFGDAWGPWLTDEGKKQAQ